MYSTSNSIMEPGKLLTNLLNEREEQLKQLQEEFSKLKESSQEELRHIQEKLDQITAMVNQSKTDLPTSSGLEHSFLKKQLGLGNDLYQTLFNIQLTYKELISIFEQHIKLLEDFKKDTSLKGLMLEPRSSYPFEMLQSSIKRVFDEQDKVAQLKTQKNDSLTELENRKKEVITATKAYQDKKKEHEELTKTSGRTQMPNSMQHKQRLGLLDIEEQIAKYEVQLAELRVSALGRKISLLNAMLTIENEKLDIYRMNLERVKIGLRISESEIQAAKDNLETERQKLSAAKVPQFEEIKKLSAKREQIKKEIDNLTTKYKIVHAKKEEFGSWTVENPSLDGYSALCDVGNKNTQLQLLEKKIDYLQTQMELQKELFQKEKVKYMILYTWYQLQQYRPIETETIDKQLKAFLDLKAKIVQDISTTNDRKNAIGNFLTFQAKENTSLRTITEEIKQEKDGMFKQYPVRFQACLNNLSEAEKLLADQADLSGKLLEVTNSINNVRDNTLREIEIIVSELQSKSLWHRSPYAISWEGIKNIIPDIIRFISDTIELGKGYLHEITTEPIRDQIERFIAPSLQSYGMANNIVLICFLLVLIIMGYFSIRNQLPSLINTITRAIPAQEQTMLYFTLHALLCITRFLQLHFLAIYSWIVIFVLFDPSYSPFSFDLFIHVIVYLIAIPALIHLSTKFIEYIVDYNKQHNYPFFIPIFTKRFVIALSIFMYSTVVILLFREAFIYATLHKSELPNILMAMHSFIIKALIIFSIGKDEILSLVSRRGFIWHWLEYIVEHYYYILLFSIIVLMILSDPYIGGYGALISHYVWAITMTVIVMRALYEIHLYIKKYSEKAFFILEEDDVKRERFTYARTWYGIGVIFFFMLFGLLGLIIGFKLWGYPVSAEDIKSLFDYHLFQTGAYDKHGETVFFTPRKFFVLLSFIAAGLIGSVLFNRYVLQKIFSVLPVDLGIQNTIMSIARYMVIMIAIYVGFQLAGLSSLLILIGIVIGSISYISKEPVGDFISYFIILVQRPVQIGDYIYVDQNIEGVVRKITPRCVILRKKDSYSIIVPNSTLLSHPISNWNYARNFVAFDDIQLIIPFNADPMQVKKIIHRVLDENIDVLKSPKYIVRLDNFGEYGFVFMIRGFISNINILRKWDIASDIRFAISKALKEENIKIAIPTRITIKEQNQ